MTRTLLRHAFLILGLSAFSAVQSAIADENAIDQQRLEAAKARAELHWKAGGYDDLAAAFDRSSIEALKDKVFVAYVAGALLGANPDKSNDVLAYVNDAVIPFITAHRAQFECLRAEDYYNMSGIPAESLADFGESPLSLRFDLAYLLLGTETARMAAGIALPEPSDWAAIVSHARENGLTNPKNAIHFDCAA